MRKSYQLKKDPSPFGYIVLVLLFFLSLPSLVKGQDLRFKRYTHEDGLVDEQGYTFKMVQDEQGFLWIPSLNGLNRFDGREFKVFQNEMDKPSGLASNSVLDICMGENNQIWLALAGEGINIYDPETGIFEQLVHDPSDPESLCGNHVQHIHKDRTGNLWIYTVKGKVCRCEKGTRQFKSYPYIEANGFWHHSDGTIWTGGGKGLYRYVPEQDTFQHFVPNLHKPNPTAQYVLSIIESPGGELWTSSKAKYQQIFNPQTATFRDFPPELIVRPNTPAKSFFKDKEGHLWIGNRAGIARFNPLTATLEKFFHDPNDPTTCQKGAIVSIFQDHGGSLWLSSFIREGLSVIHTLNNPFSVISIKANLAAFPLNDRQMLLANPDGFSVFDIYKKEIVPNFLPPILQTARADHAKGSPNGDIWWWDAQQRKIFSYNLNTHQKRTLLQQDLFEVDAKGNLWFAKPLYYNIEKEKLINYFQKVIDADTSGLIKKAVFHRTSVTIDPQGRVWLGTNNAGLVRYNPATEAVRIFQHRPGNPESLVSGEVNMILSGSNGWMYISTGNGFSIYKPEFDQFFNLDKTNGLANTMKPSMIEDQQGRIWMGTERGMVVLNPENLSIQNFDENDGLPHGAFFERNATKDALGNFYYAMRDKLFRFHPDSVHLYKYVVPVVLTDFFLSLKKINPGEQNGIVKKNIDFQEKLELQYTQSDFGFRYVSPNFYKSDKIQYFYQLENYNNNWIANGNKLEVHFTNIPAGDYRFKVKARTEAGFWTKEAKTINISILPPWWETGWAYVGYSLLFLSLLIGIRQYEMKRLNTKNEAKRLAELDTLKTRLYTNITHEFRTPLTVIQGMAEQMQGDPEAKKLIRRNSKNLLHLVTQMLDMAKFESGKMDLKLIHLNIISFLNYLTESFQSYAATKNIQLTFFSEETEVMMDYDPEKVQHIIANLLSNAIKFTQEKGKISLHVSKSPILLRLKEQALLKIKVRDNGIGIQEEHLPHLFDRFYQADDTPTRHAAGTGIGLALARELVELMGGTISVKSEWGKGTEFTMLIPIYRNAKPDPSMGNTPLSIEEEKHPEIESLWIPGTSPIKEIPENSPGDSQLPLLLIIEDNRDVVIYIKTCLQEDYNIRVADDGQEGINKALEIVPDIIISDVMMPEKDGYEVTQTLKNDERTSHIPIILLTAKADMDSKIAGLERGADAYLTKPFHKKELLIRLANLVRVRQKLQARYGSLTPFPPTKDKAFQLEDAFLKKVREAVESNLADSDFTVPYLCREVGLSQPQLYRKIKALTDKSIAVYIRAIRLQKGKTLLETTDLTVSEVAYEVGFSDPSYFSKAYSQTFGYPPSDNR